MSKEKKGEIKYVSLSTTLLIAVICLVAGFLAGNIYNTYKTGFETAGRQAVFSPGVSQGPATTIQQTNRILALEKEVEANPGNQEAWLELGNLYFDTDNYENAIRAYRKYIELNPNNSNVWTDMGVMYRRSGQPHEAVAAFERAIEINPDHEQPRFNKGIVYLHDLNNPEVTIKTWEELVKINPDFRSPTGQLLKDMIDSLKSN